MRFDVGTADPVPDLLLVSVMSSEGPALFVVHKSYQAGTTAVCDPPQDVFVTECRELFRVAVAAPMMLHSKAGNWSLYTMDCSLGGLSTCAPMPLEIGTEVRVKLDLDGDLVLLAGEIRHCRPMDQDLPVPPSDAQQNRVKCPSIMGLRFLGVAGDAERRLNDFVGRHQRRLMPRVQARALIEYRSQGRKYFIETQTKEVSPGDVVLLVNQRHVPGDAMELRMRLGRDDFELLGRAVACTTTGEGEGAPVHKVKAALGDLSGLVETRLRKAVRDRTP
jgi:hypothetical protein